MSQNRNPKVDEKTPTQPGRPQIGNELRAMNFVQFHDSLQLSDNLPFDDQIDPLPSNLHSSIFHVYRPLRFVRQPTRLQLDAHGLSINRFEKSGAECSMHPNRTADRF